MTMDGFTTSRAPSEIDKNGSIRSNSEGRISILNLSSSKINAYRSCFILKINSSKKNQNGMLRNSDMGKMTPYSRTTNALPRIIYCPIRSTLNSSTKWKM
jgi:hypothetical protein